MSQRWFGVCVAVALLPWVKLPSPQRQAPIDLSGLQIYWGIQSKLGRGEEPLDALWDSLFATAGYAALESRERRRASLVLAMRLASHPSYADSAGRTAQQATFLGRAVAHLSEAGRQRQALIAATPSLAVDLGRESELGRKAVAAFLGDSLIAGHTPPPVALILFGPDGRGYPNLIIGDLLQLARRRERDRFFAHELFHYYRRFVARTPRVDPGADTPWLGAIGNVEEEGLADMMDKSEVPDLSLADIDARYAAASDRAFYRDYQHHVLEGPRWVHFADSALGAVPAADSLRLDAGRRFASALPIGGRALGAFMARTIARSQPRVPLGSLAGDPVGFWLAYHDAAQRSGAPSFSPSTIETMRRLGGLLHTVPGR